jgi:hypothetical protein
MKRATSLLASLVVSAPALALAHPGHGTTNPDSWRHYLTEPVHVVTAIAGIAAAIGIGWAWRRARRSRV